MYKLLRIALFAAPLVGGAAWAQGSGTSGSAGALGTTLTPPVTNDTRTPMQQKAERLDEATPALPGDATEPSHIPATVPHSDRSGMPDKKIHRRRNADERAIQRRSDVPPDTKPDTKIEKSDLGNRDQLNSDK